MPIDDADENMLNKIIEDSRILGGQRMVRSEQPVTDDLARKVNERFHYFLQRTKKSAEAAARSLGMSASTLSQVASGSYAADREKHIRAIDQWTEQQMLKEAAPGPPGFVKTRVAEKIYGVVNWVMKINSIALIHGPNGCGKTMTLQAIRAETPGAIYLSIDSSGLRVRAVFEALADALKMPRLKLSANDLFREVVAVLKDTGRLVIIDEIHKLAGRQNDNALHVLRDLHDHTGCPMVWSGNGRIASYIRANKTEGHDPLDQIFGRIAWWLDLMETVEGEGDDGGTRLYTVDDIRAVFAKSKIRLTPDGEDYLTDFANNPSLGCLRGAKHLVAVAAIVSKGQPVTEAMLRAIQSQRWGKRAAMAAESQIQYSVMAKSA